MKIALVDDEQECLDKMAGFCQSFGQKHWCYIETVQFTSGETFLEAFSNGGFSVVFMDIYMDGTDGIATAIKMRKKDSRCILVFLTYSMEFMPDAFSCHAFEYITKPFTKQRITDVLSDVLEVLPQPQKYAEFIISRKPVHVLLDNIVSVVTDAHYLDITLTDGRKLRCRMTMHEFMKKTGTDIRFILINKGIAVNAEYITGFEDNCCILENNARLPVRVRDRLKVEQTVHNYNFEKIRQQQPYFTTSSYK